MDWHWIIMDWNVAYQWCCVALWASKTVDHACEFWSVRQVSVITNRKSTNHSSNLLYLNTLADVYFNRLLKFCWTKFFSTLTLKYLWRATVSVKIAETLCCLLTLPKLVSARFGELTAIDNIGRTRRRARSEKTVLGGNVPTIFVWDCSTLTV